MASGHEGLLALAQGRAPGGQSFEDFHLDAHNEAQRQRARALSPRRGAGLAGNGPGDDATHYIEQADEAEYGDLVRTPWMGDHAKGQFLMYPALHEGGHRAELEAWRAALEEGQ